MNYSRTTKILPLIFLVSSAARANQEDIRTVGRTGFASSLYLAGFMNQLSGFVRGEIVALPLPEVRSVLGHGLHSQNGAYLPACDQGGEWTAADPSGEYLFCKNDADYMYCPQNTVKLTFSPYFPDFFCIAEKSYLSLKPKTPFPVHAPLLRVLAIAGESLSISADAFKQSLVLLDHQSVLEAGSAIQEACLHYARTVDILAAAHNKGSETAQSREVLTVLKRISDTMNSNSRKLCR